MEKTYFNIKIIKKFMKDNNLSKTKFCKLCGICPSTLSHIMNDNLNLTPLPFVKIARSMKVQLKDLFTNKKCEK